DAVVARAELLAADRAQRGRDVLHLRGDLESHDVVVLGIEQLPAEDHVVERIASVVPREAAIGQRAVHRVARLVTLLIERLVAREEVYLQRLLKVRDAAALIDRAQRVDLALIEGEMNSQTTHRRFLSGGPRPY